MAKEGDNETVEQLCEEIVTQWAACYFSEGMKRRDGEYSKMVVIETAGLANRILAAHRSEMESKDAEIEKLRALVKGLLEASAGPCTDCDYDCGSNREDCIVHAAAKYIEGMEVEK